MPAHHLTLPADQVADQVEAVLAGAAASEHPELADAVETYRTAGRAALQKRHERAWFQAHIRPLDWSTAETAFATHVMPILDRLTGSDWWFLRKHPHWRLRLHTSDHDMARALLDRLVSQDVIAGWQESIYEPETAVFGGSYAIALVHDLFCADSRGVLTYTQQHTPGIGRRELSLLLIRALQHHAGLDPFEAGDVFDRVTGMRPPLDDAAFTRVDAMATHLRAALAIPLRADHPLFAANGPLSYAAPWLIAHIDTGRHLRGATDTGLLERGLRTILAHIVIFHWNRLGLAATTQSVLAHAAKAALFPEEPVR
ncbi:thiopeptide-type bacteriocin biosynthesis protein [Nucisporomicrobium flavum]|uniref:thiopeptide-type bacteriocin biosynthesis protein n=1 Tax=Nucisporomicrobium flavum TaxID=2785915 RepID=UPI003C2EEB51